MHTQLYNLNLNIAIEISRCGLPTHPHHAFIYIKKNRHKEAVYSFNVSIIAVLCGSIILNYRQGKKNKNINHEHNLIKTKKK